MEQKKAKKKTTAKMSIVRSRGAGVFFGEVAKVDGNTVTLRNVRKVWEWYGACAVEELAVNGTTMPAQCKMTVTVAEMVVLDVLQIIPCTEKAEKSLGAVKEWKRG